MKKGANKKQANPRHFRDNIEVLVFAVVMALGLKVFAVEAYQIPTGSMMPNLMGTDLLDRPGGPPTGGIHDRVLVDKLSYLLRDPERWEVVVFRYPLATINNYVKRLVGMPDEELAIQHGDVYARPLGTVEDFQILRKPKEIQQTLWKRMHPKPGDPPGGFARWDKSGQYQESDGAVRLNGKGRIQYRNWRNEYRHGLPDKIYFRVPSQGQDFDSQIKVSDLRMDFEVTPEANAGELEIFLECGPQPRTQPLKLILKPGQDQHLLLLPNQEEIQVSLPIATGEAVSGSLAFWDHTVSVTVKSQGESFQHDQDLDLQPKRVLQNASGFGSETGGWLIQAPEVFRDIHYTPPAGYTAVQTYTCEIEKGHYFMLGDNTLNSLDSRQWEALVHELDPPIGGVSVLRGDSLPNGQDPLYNNPRLNRNGTVRTFRNEYGEYFVYPLDFETEGKVRKRTVKSSSQTEPLVPRRYILGKAMAVFLPIPPFSPLVRIKLVR
ncbi:MAG: hypothetical protein DWQ01_09045 [Planctomycetota bacterium]|nr:MAG: hypothetical protein DWQ01_09045 [Planctomycetota bacterium]